MKSSIYSREQFGQSWTIWTILTFWTKRVMCTKLDIVDKFGLCGQNWTIWTKSENSANCTNYWDKIERLKDQNGSLLLYKSKLRITTEL